ncbi:hypothetical protein ACL1IW_06110 [Corynebacterium striatum]
MTPHAAVTPADPRDPGDALHLSKPLAHAPGRAKRRHPKPGDKLTAATVHGDVPVTIEGNNAWRSWFDDGPEKSDAGAVWTKPPLWFGPIGWLPLLGFL